MPPNAPEMPGTPSRRRVAATDEKTLDTRIKLICHEWDLGLSLNDVAGHDSSIRRKCISTLRFCFHKNLFDRAYQDFTREATILYQGWVNKPRAERGTIPDATRRFRRPVNAKEQDELLQLLFKTFMKHQTAWNTINGGTPPSIKAKVERYRTELEGISPISSVLSPGPRSDCEKRRREESFADIPTTKRKSRERIRGPESSPQPLDMAPPRGRASRVESRAPRSANTSFASTVGTGMSVFSQKEQDPYFQDSQTTEPDNEAFTTLQDDRTAPSSSDYQSSSFEARVKSMLEEEILLDHPKPAGPEEEALSQNISDFGIENTDTVASETIPEDQIAAESHFRRQLDGVFPTMPCCLHRALPCVAYEITRVFLHADVPLSEFKGTVDTTLHDYDTLWRSLRKLDVLYGKPFPERSSKEAWACALDGYGKGFRAVAFSGSLHFTPIDSNSFFRLKLDPLKLEKMHRLGRRFGHDRFLEICIPQLSGRRIPETLSRLGSRGPQIIYEWLVDATHTLIGRTWKPFMVKNTERKPKRNIVITKAVEDVDTSFRVFFFATEGIGLHNMDYSGPERAHDSGSCSSRPKITISKLLDCVRPTEENKEQPFLKLFNRTTLALSRNYATLVLLPEQIKARSANITFGDKKNVMNDGCGRISSSLALKVTGQLGLSYLPWAFQGRLGEAKGLWVTDRYENVGKDWIETYPSQRKWLRGQQPQDPCDRTFEVVEWARPLESAKLNLQFLPLLMERAKNKKKMKKAISKILEEGLASKAEEIQNAMDDPQSFRQWVRDSNANTNERLKGSISYKGGLPVVIEERLNILLDSGFDPKKLMFVKDLAKKAFKKRTDELKEKLNITVGKSTYAFMVPDFWGVLEEGEVYIDCSSFVDNVSGFSGATLSGVDVLVARSPAHFISDMQKVRVVIKEELVGLKDVIIFSAKGKRSLADKLSGGDYDGDIAWVCWDPTIVSNFETADVPQARNLVEEGLIQQDTTTYLQLTKGLSMEEATSKFLKRSFEFNMQQSMLGICTTYKEHVCYTTGSVDTTEAEYLSQLLSNLVDQPKQGFIFNEEHWDIFRKRVVKTIPRQPRYKTDDPRPNEDHIIDHLKWVSEKGINKSLQNFHQAFPDPPYWDPSLASFYFKFADLATRDPTWRKLLDDLQFDILKLKSIWGKKFQRNRSKRSNPNTREDEESSIPDFSAFVNDLSEQFREIQPREETPASIALTMCPGSNAEFSNWELLKASTAVAAFVHFERPRLGTAPYVSTFVWWIAGKQLAGLKALCHDDPSHAVIQPMYIVLKPDAPLIKRLRCEGQVTYMEDTASIADASDLDAIDDD